MTYPISIIGLGAGTIDQLPLGIYRRIMSAQRLVVRTKDHPVIAQLAEEGIEIESFDHVYEACSDDFEQVYQVIVDKILQLAEQQPVLYAVPGHPAVAERTTVLLRESSADVTVLGGSSFLDDMFQAVEVDPIDGFQLVDSFDLASDQLNPNQHLIIMQVFNSLMAGDVKLTLMEQYPWEHSVFIVDAAGTDQQQIQEVPLHELDHFDGTYNLRSVYVPPLDRHEQVNSFGLLAHYIDEIISAEGDPWIIDQTNQSLIPYLEEETAELIEAIESEDPDHIVEELGDVLMQVMYHARIGELAGEFQLEDVIAALNRKLYRRHPHVFGDATAKTAEEVEILWQQIKAQEKEGD